ncbi:MAG: hypothetical protein NVS3B12_26110 [Acidimicrobiales bacterium]
MTQAWEGVAGGGAGIPPAPIKVIVVGGGIGGATAALRLAQWGAEVVLVERAPELGGLVMSLSIGGTPIERFYHHVFPHEYEIIALIDELGLGPRLEWFRSSVGMLIDGRVWPFVSPVDLLRFAPLGPLDRVRTAVGGLRSMRWRAWPELDAVAAATWMGRLTGRRAYSVVWEPLLRAKFGAAARDVPAAWLWGRIQQRAAARRSGVEQLGYLRGGFAQLFAALRTELTRRGVEVRTSTSVRAIAVDTGRATGVLVDGPGDGPARVIRADAVVFAGALPDLVGLVPEVDRDPRWTAIGAMGAMAVVLELRRQVTSTYWINVCDPRLPMTAFIEHTNLVPRSDYGGRYVAYMARYFCHDDPLAHADIASETERWLDALADGGLPGFSRADVVAAHPARTMYAAPLVAVGHLGRIPPVRSHLTGLYVATTAQIYPHDRGMNEGVRMGSEAARHVVSDAGATTNTGVGAPARGDARRCPVCGGGTRRFRWVVPEQATEAGVNPEAFRPSSDRFGQPAGSMVTCGACGHGTLDRLPDPGAVDAAYADAADEVSIREERGQIRTAGRALARIEGIVAPGRILDVGCWTGSLLVAARARGWEPVGLEPSRWAAGQARRRGLDIRSTTLADAPDLERGAFRAVTACDVLEHLGDPGTALERIHGLLEERGILYVTVPDAGSVLARVMGRRWWSVLPMHLQYFTRSSAERLIEMHGFRVVSVRSHAKVFTARYYAERLGGYRPSVATGAVRALEAVRLADRLVAPDLRDRLEVVAVTR